MPIELAGSQSRFKKLGLSQLAFAGIFGIAVVFVGCGGEATEPDGSTQVVIDPGSATLLSLGDTKNLTATARNANGDEVSGLTFTWSSSDELVVAVNSSGMVTAVDNGSATVTAAVQGGATGTATIIVEQRVDSVMLTPTHNSLVGIGTTQAFVAEALDANGNPIVGKEIAWASLNTNVAAIDAAGNASAQGSGQVTIAATVDGTSSYALLTISTPSLSPVSSWDLDTTLGFVPRDVWGTSSSAVFAVGDSGAVLRYDGVAWTEMQSVPDKTVHGVWGTAPDDLFVATGQAVLHYDGNAWSDLSRLSHDRFRGVWGTAPVDVVAVGPSLGIIRFSGVRLDHDWGWDLQDVGLYDLNDVWGVSASDIFAVGEDGWVFHFDGSTEVVPFNDTVQVWVGTETGSANDLYGVWAASVGDIYAVGGGGTILRNDGTGWSQMNSGTNESLLAVWGASSVDIYAVGNNGTILHYDGGSWSQMTSGTGETLRGVWGAPGGDVYVVGGSDQGLILRGER